MFSINAILILSMQSYFPLVIFNEWNLDTFPCGMTAGGPWLGCLALQVQQLMV